MLREQGQDAATAALGAAKLRLRPIIMTSFAFILGVVPLIISSGAGAASRASMGITVFSGMLMATFLGIFLVPVLFVVFDKFVRRTPPSPQA
jgi:HAE1 family hydrophobic/amphiphilic exporter-1